MNFFFLIFSATALLLIGAGMVIGAVIFAVATMTTALGIISSSVRKLERVS